LFYLRSYIIYLAVAITMVGCKEFTSTQTVTTSTQTPRSNPNAPAKWPTSRFPLEVKIASNFSAGEISLIESMGTEWIDAGNNELQFFDLTNTTANKDLASLDDYYDSEMGIYKSSSWFDSVSNFALAITQFYGYRQNTGMSSEYIQLVHADVIMNYAHYNFTTDLSSGYDLPSVILHELGHFLGIYHNTDYSKSSVMVPSILSRTSERDTYTFDEQTIAEKYGINSAVLPLSNQSLAVTAGASRDVAVASNEPEFVQGRIELRADQHCYHYINGQVIEKHFVEKSFNRRRAKAWLEKIKDSE
jgi:hypothetical protein